MSSPFKPEDASKDPGITEIIQIIGTEIVSAQSALNMYPEPIKDHNSQSGYLSETDAWAKHAMEHMRNVFAWNREMQTKCGKLEDALFQASRKNKIDDDTVDTLLAILRGHTP